jgi:thiol-disulfide isomerase/thioredoxin
VIERIVGIGGSWCPNCQNEAPILEKLYRKYHDRGPEIEELSFEEPPQLQNPCTPEIVSPFNTALRR